LTIAYLNTVWNVDEFCHLWHSIRFASGYHRLAVHFFFIFKHSRIPNRSWI